MSSILCIGNAGVDLLAPAGTQWPSRGGAWRLVEDDLRIKAGGCGLDTALGLAELGAPAKLVAGVGAGSHGRFVRRVLAESGIELPAPCVHPRLRTPLEILVEDEQSKPSALHFVGASAHVDAALLTELHEEGCFEDCTAIHIAGLGLLPAIETKDFVHALVRILAQSSCCELSLDVSLREARTRDEWHASLAPLFATGCVHVFSPNYDEACQIHGVPRSATIPDRWPDDFHEYLLTHFDGIGADFALILRDGARGSFAVDVEGRVRSCQAERVDTVLDLSSAGEAWWSGFLARRHDQRARGNFDRDVASLAIAAETGHRVAACAIQSASSQAWCFDELRKQDFSGRSRLAPRSAPPEPS